MPVCRLTDLSSIFTYQGEETCAADGMCQVKCPVKINTGELIKHIRHENLGGQQTRAQKTAMVRARHVHLCKALHHGLHPPPFTPAKLSIMIYTCPPFTYASLSLLP